MSIMADAPITPETAERADRLYRLYHRRVVALAYRRTRNRDVADDVAAETWLRAVRWIPTLKASDDRAWSWLATIAGHAALDYYRPKRAKERVTDWSDDERELPVETSAEDSALSVIELEALVERLQGCCTTTAMAAALYEAVAA